MTDKDYSWLKDHCYRTLKRPCSPNTRNEHLAILDLIKEHEDHIEEDAISRQAVNILVDDIKAEINERLWKDDAERVFEIIDKHMAADALLIQQR